MNEAVSNIRKRKKKSAFDNLGQQIGFGDKRPKTVSQQAKKKLEIDNIERQRRKDNEELESAHRLTLDNILKQSGLGISVATFYLFSLLAGGLAFVGSNFIGIGFLFSIAPALFFGLALPRWYVLYKRKKRLANFIKELPNALDSICRNLKSGIPSLEAIKILAREAKEPLKSEFEIVVQEQGMGLTLAHAFERMAIRVPIEETRFLAITVEIQSKSGGNLTEVLSNLSKVLRDRRKLKQKIVSITAEARAGAYIVGGIPFFIMGAVYTLTPEYMEFFWTDNVGIIVLVGCIIWQMIGVFVMWKMANFKI